MILADCLWFGDACRMRVSSIDVSCMHNVRRSELKLLYGDDDDDEDEDEDEDDGGQKNMVTGEHA